MTYVVSCRNENCGVTLFVTESWEVALAGIEWDCLVCAIPRPQRIDVEYAKGAA